jgi:hypothetical protein
MFCTLDTARLKLLTTDLGTDLWRDFPVIQRLIIAFSEYIKHCSAET